MLFIRPNFRCHMPRLPRGADSVARPLVRPGARILTRQMPGDVVRLDQLANKGAIRLNQVANKAIEANSGVQRGMLQNLLARIEAQFPGLRNLLSQLQSPSQPMFTGGIVPPSMGQVFQAAASDQPGLAAQLGGAAGMAIGAKFGGPTGAMIGQFVGSTAAQLASPLIKLGTKAVKGIGKRLFKAAKGLGGMARKAAEAVTGAAGSVVNAVAGGVKKIASGAKKVGKAVINGFKKLKFW